MDDQYVSSVDGLVRDEQSVGVGVENFADTHKVHVLSRYQNAPCHLQNKKFKIKILKFYKVSVFKLTQIFIRRCSCQSHFLLKVVRFATCCLPMRPQT